MVFKLERERPAMAIHENFVYFVKDRMVKRYDCDNEATRPLCRVKPYAEFGTLPHTMAFNAAENSLYLVSVDFNSDLTHL